MTESLIRDAAEFEALCDEIRRAGLVACDTEFISEGYHRPRLCLLQLSVAGGRVAAVDPLAVTDVGAWWSIVADDDTTVVVHAGRQEVRFCLDAGVGRPRRLVDVQIAEGLRSRSFPLNHERLVQRVIGKEVAGSQTRTDWQRRPLSDHQIAYALDDVRYLLPVWEKQRIAFESLERTSWAEAEFERMIDEVESERSPESWLRLSGLNRLNRRSLAVARELFNWRESCGAELDQPVRRVLRDDLLIDVAKRQPKSEHELLATRDMNRRNFRRHAATMVECVRRALALNEDDCPRRSKARDMHSDEHVLGQLLAIALANRCAQMNVSPSLVGTGNELKHLVRWHVFGERDGEPPRLSQGWRAELCGDLLTDVLDGKVKIRVADAGSDHPLVFEE